MIRQKEGESLIDYIKRCKAEDYAFIEETKKLLKNARKERKVENKKSL